MTAIHRGSTIEKLSKGLSREFGVGYNNAERLVRTELNYIQNRAALDSISSSGLEYYQYIAALDNRTCPRCGSLDGRIFSVEETMQGENYPPLHPRCRCTVSVALGEDLPVNIISGYKEYYKTANIKNEDNFKGKLKSFFKMLNV